MQVLNAINRPCSGYIKAMVPTACTRKMQDLWSLVFLLFVVKNPQGEVDSAGRLSPVVIPSGSNGACPADEVLAAQREAIKEEITPILNDLIYQPPCACGGPGQWSRIAFFNMSDPSQQCPSSWNLFTSPVKGCVSSVTSGRSCDSAIFPSNGKLYSRVCGRVNAYQKGSVNGFYPGFYSGRGLEEEYVDGVSLTHGAPGSRQHIWTFVASGTSSVNSCPCTSTAPWPYQVPSFIGDKYFCETGNHGSLHSSGVATDDPLWDGSGCGSGSSCCEFNNPPWFCATLPQPTTDDLELRICRDQDSSNEDIIMSLVEVHVK